VQLSGNGSGGPYSGSVTSSVNATASGQSSGVTSISSAFATASDAGLGASAFVSAYNPLGTIEAGSTAIARMTTVFLITPTDPQQTVDSVVTQLRDDCRHRCARQCLVVNRRGMG